MEENARQFREWKIQFGVLGIGKSNERHSSQVSPSKSLEAFAAKDTILSSQGKDRVVVQKETSQYRRVDFGVDEASHPVVRKSMLMVWSGLRLSVIDQPQGNEVQRISELRALPMALEPKDDGKPIPMLLWCPMCNQRHIDEGDFATIIHHTHACQHCGMVWRPAVVATVGVEFLPGFKNT